jgi:tRNA U34 5-carboxymethylaminomethyl modifying enzyme MnmG/GidA
VCSWQKRIEKGTIDIYSNDESIINELETKFYNNVSSIFKPSGEITEPNTLKVKKLPQGIYKYRVYLLPHRLKDEIDEKKKYLTWIKNQAGKIKLTECVERWFINTEWNWDPRYVLVDEESTLLMLKLRNPETIGRIYRFVTD